MTIAEKRKIELDRLVAFRTDNPTEEDRREAKRLMNSYYRLCGLSETNLYLANNEHTCNSRYTKESEDRELRWYERLKKEFNNYCGLTLFYNGYFPSIGTKDERGRVSMKIYPYFY